MSEPIDNIANLFEELENALVYLPDYGKVYQLFNHVFQQCVDDKTRDVSLNFAGTFAKTDYLLKEYGASGELRKKTNDTRIRLRKRYELTVEEMRKWHLYDLRNICGFIAFLNGVAIPKSLECRFPVGQEETYELPLIGDSLRVIADSWDDEFVYCTTEWDDASTTQVCYAHNSFYNYDWSYLKPLFRKGAQLNLVRPRVDDGVFYPELIIFEPDYLIDISAIAKCFTNYAESPWVHLINKIQPSQTTEAILLGNLAGQFLDEQIHQSPDVRTYTDSVNQFWRHNSLGLITADISPDFHANAQQQKVNIAKAMGEVLPSAVSHFDTKEGMVEPSFFSEMLGLQGRMDYLQLDFKVLIEQKSGKGEFPYDNFVKPRQREEHYVQMLLYVLLVRYNYREIYENNNHELHAFLLYSKYKESLLGLSFAPELIFRAMKIRNELACCELGYTQPDGFRFLESLTPEALNQKHDTSSLWSRYQSVQIAEVLAPIRQASELEKSYYFRFLTFIANEHLLSKIGNKTKENSGFASIWLDSLDDKRQAGTIYDRLTLVDPNADTVGVVSKITLRFSENESNDMSNFRIGDIVILYPYEEGEEPDARKTMVFRSSIETIESDRIVLLLRASQSDPIVFLRSQTKLWAIEHDFMESSYSSLYRGMHAFLSAPKTRRDLLLLQREPDIDETCRLNGDYGKFNELSLRVKQARDLFLIIGPPGTGKTSYGMLNTLKEELTEPDGTILLLSYTNRAVDEICSKLYKEDIDFIRLGGSLSCSSVYQDKLLNARSHNCANVKELTEIIKKTRVFVSTTTSLCSNISLLQLKQFSLAIIDEASQILEPHLIGILSAQINGAPAIRKLVFIGDHKQLPAVVQQTPDVSKVEDPVLNQQANLQDCRLSLFERLLSKYRNNPQVVYMLRKQGRMHQDIALFPNIYFYNSQLQVVPLPHQETELAQLGCSDNGIDNMLLTRRIVFLNAKPLPHPVSDKVNAVEAEMIAATVHRIYLLEKESFDPQETVGVIVPYRNQIATVRNTIARLGIEALKDITIDTVERYQGSQRRYIIYGFTVQQNYQLDFLTNNVFVDFDGSVIDRKLNVAMTRAEEHLIMIGNAPMLSRNPLFAQLIEFARSRDGYYDVLPEDFVRGQF